MTLKLILMRHAKSDWSSPADGDIDRPLNARGRNNAPLIGKWLATRGHVPETALVSSAARTRETWGLVSGAFKQQTSVDFKETLYLASAETMFQMLCSTNRANSVLMLAHNPGTAILGNALAKDIHPHPRFSDFPTAAVAVFEFEIEKWGQLAPGTGLVTDFAIPRELETGTN